jgi:hypothetical protein
MFVIKINMAQQSFIQQASASASAPSKKRQLYDITRSEATWLTNTFIAALEKSADGSIEAFRVFRDALETQKPAYLGKFNNSQNAVVQGTFYAMAAHLFDVMERLFKHPSNLCVLPLCKHLPTSEAIAYESIYHLHRAVRNWYLRHEKTITEDWTDCCEETHTCAICTYHDKTTYYYSTAYGLELAVCPECLGEHDTIEKNDEEYVPSASETDESDEESEEASKAEASEAEASEAEASEAEASEADSAEDDDDPDYVCEEESEYEEDSESDDDLESNATEETDLSEEDNDNLEENTSRATASLSLPTTPVSDEQDKFFGCEGCDFEWRDGWRLGWRAAMKHIRNYANKEKINKDAPRCATCDISHGDLQKCARCNSVHYCSEKCQRDDWSAHKRVCRAEN